MWNRDHSIQISVNDLNSVSADSITHLRNLRWAFMMPAGSDGLQDEARRGESQWVRLFVHLLRRKPVAIGGEMPLSVGLLEPLLTEHTGFDIGELRVRGLGKAGRIKEGKNQMQR